MGWQGNSAPARDGRARAHHWGCYRGTHPVATGVPPVDAMDTTTTDPRPDAPPIERRRRSVGRAVWLILAALATLLVLDLVLVGIGSLAARRHLQEGREALQAGKTALRDGDVDGAAAAFEDAGRAFRAAAGDARTPWYTLAGAIPVLGRTPDTVRAISDAGVRSADAAAAIAAALGEVPGGLGGLAPRDGAIPLEPLAGLATAVAEASELADQALAGLEESASSLVLGPVSAARAEALEAIGPLARQLEAGAAILRGLPAFLGQEGPTRYFFGAANPAEERGTGGLIGAYAILTIDHGTLSFSPFRPVQGLPPMDEDTWRSPSQEYIDNVSFYWAAVDFWLNTNITPDFPLAAGTIAMSYEQATGEPLDGVIVADPFALQALMRVTGPVEVRSAGVRVTPERIVRFVSNEAYALFDTNEERKAVLGEVSADVLGRFLSISGDDLARQRALLRAFDDGHVKVWTTDEAMQEGLASTGAGGAFRPDGTDAISLVTNSGSGTKLDFFQRRTITYDVALDPGGSAEATLRAELENDAPTSGFPRYVIGPFPGYTENAGDNVAVVHLYVDEGGVLRDATRNGRAVTLDRFEQDGHPYFDDYVHTAAGDTSVVEAGLFLPRAWEGNSSGGTYRLSFVDQVTIHPAELRVSITLPDGMHVTSMSDELRVEGDTVVYAGVPEGNLDLQVTFAPSLPVRLWRDVTRPF
jgi:hypothetical protein